MLRCGPARVDDSWETVDLTPPDGSLDPVYEISGDGAWLEPLGDIRAIGAMVGIASRVVTPVGEKLSGPPGVDDGYQVFRTKSAAFGGFSSTDRSSITRSR